MRGINDRPEADETAADRRQRSALAKLGKKRPRGARNRMVRVNPGHPASKPLMRLLELSFGPQHVVAEEFAAIPGASE